MVTERYEPWTHTPFENWVVDEGLKVVQGQSIADVHAVELAPWTRTGCETIIIDLTADPFEGVLINNSAMVYYLHEIAPSSTYKVERHMYEEMFFVLKGRGATIVWYDDGPKQTFEWQEGSVFSIPLNAWHEIYNGSGEESARLFASTNAPAVFDLFASPELVFNCPMSFRDRFDPTDELYFSGKTTKLEDRYMETNFIPNAHAVSLDRWALRGPGANMMIAMAGGNFICHLSEFPANSYKKAHTQEIRRRRGLAGNVAYLMLSGEGYDLQWPFGVKPGPGVPWDMLDYRKGSLLTSGVGYHQHFNIGDEPIRYIVLRQGNPRYVGAVGAAFKDSGGSNIEFEDEDPAIRELFEARKRGK